MRKHVDCEIWREILSEACVNNFVFRYGEASYFRDIVVILFRGIAVTEWKLTQELFRRMPAAGGSTSTFIRFFIISRMYLRSLLSLFASVKICVALRKQLSFRISTILPSLLIWTCLSLKSVTLTRISQHACHVWQTYQERCTLALPSSPSSKSSASMAFTWSCMLCVDDGFSVSLRLTLGATCGIGSISWVRLAMSIVNGPSRFETTLRSSCSGPCLEFEVFEGCSSASHETQARDRFDCPLSTASVAGDRVACGRRFLLSVDVALSSLRRFPICVGSWGCRSNDGRDARL